MCHHVGKRTSVQLSHGDILQNVEITTSLETPPQPNQRGLFQDKVKNKSDPAEYHLGLFKESDDILALQNLLVPPFIPPYRLNSVLFAYLIPAEEQQNRQGQSWWAFDRPE